MSAKKKISLVFFILLVGSFFAVFFLKTSFTISQVIEWKNSAQISPFAKDIPNLPEKDSDRINILLLGIRGLNDPGDGKLLSDAIVMVSIKKSAGQIALISIPRDLYVEIWDLWQRAKINSAYSYNGLDCAKKTVSLAIGQHVDYAVSVNFQAFSEIVDTLGGVTIYLDEPFEESFQWTGEGWEESKYWFKKKVSQEEINEEKIENEEQNSILDDSEALSQDDILPTDKASEVWVFHVPAGENTLDSKTALYYIRSRFSTNDFDRMRRQQQVLMALKKKVLSLGFLTNPIKIYNLLDIAGENVRTDIGFSDIKDLIILADDLDTKNVKTLVLDISSSGLLYHTFINKEYVLLPVGDNFNKIQEACQNIFD